MTREHNDRVAMTRDDGLLKVGDNVEGMKGAILGWRGWIVAIGSTGITVQWDEDDQGGSRAGTQPGRGLKPEWLRKVSA